MSIELPDGLTLHGAIIEGRTESSGGWLVFEVDQYDLDSVLPANLNGWTWV